MGVWERREVSQLAVGAPAPARPLEQEAPRAHPAREVLRRLLRNRLALLGLVAIGAVVMVVALGDILAPVSPRAQNIRIRLQPPGFVDPRTAQVMWLGTDHLGRDVLSRVLYGSRISLAVSLPAVLLSAFLGLLLGMLAGYYRGWPDILLMRLVDLQLAFPFILLALAIVALTGPSLQNIILVFAVTSWPPFARTVRGSVLSLREKEFIDAARSLGARDPAILWRHLLPNLMSPLLVLASFQVARMIMLESSLGFLGLGIQPPTPTWGNMLADGRDYIRDAWWIATFPGLAIMITAAGVNFLGDGLRDVLDPTLQHNE